MTQLRNQHVFFFIAVDLAIITLKMIIIYQMIKMVNHKDLTKLLVVVIDDTNNNIGKPNNSYLFSWKNVLIRTNLQISTACSMNIECFLRLSLILNKAVRSQQKWQPCANIRIPMYLSGYLVLISNNRYMIHRQMCAIWRLILIKQCIILHVGSR